MLRSPDLVLEFTFADHLDKTSSSDLNEGVVLVLVLVYCRWGWVRVESRLTTSGSDLARICPNVVSSIRVEFLFPYFDHRPESLSEFACKRAFNGDAGLSENDALRPPTAGPRTVADGSGGVSHDEMPRTER
jgi:hypothetical protein